MRLLLTGCNGQVGFELQRSLAPLGEVIAIDHADCNLAEPDTICRIIRTVRPDIIVNPAAYTAVDKAESEPDLAAAVNAAAPGILGEEAAKLSAFVVHYSTDYVFDGTKTGAYTENDDTNPQSVYGHTKRDGELALVQASPRHIILRTSWVVGAHGGNFAKTMLRLAAERDSLAVVADQWGAPTSAALLADITALLVRQQTGAPTSFPYGIYHCVASGETNWCDYARYVIGAAINAGKPLRAAPKSIQAIATADYPKPAKRPANSRLDTRKFQKTFGLELPHWQGGLDHILQQIL